MTSKTEECLRAVLALDDTIAKDLVERAIAIMKGTPDRPSDLCRVVSFKEAVRILEVDRQTVHGYILKGYLTPVLGLGGRAIGINGNSLDAFRSRRIVHCGGAVTPSRSELLRAVD